jgi:hypothetical protein
MYSICIAASATHSNVAPVISCAGGVRGRHVPPSGSVLSPGSPVHNPPSVHHHLPAHTSSEHVAAASHSYQQQHIAWVAVLQPPAALLFNSHLAAGPACLP